VAYNNHDIDDGVRAGLFALDDLKPLPLVGDIIGEIDREYPNLDKNRRLYGVVRRLIGRMVEDIIAETARRLDALKPASADDIRRAGAPVVAFSPDVAARRVVRDMFELYMVEPNCLPTEWFAKTEGQNDAARARIIADFIAGMTDSYALLEHKRLFDISTYEL
jgi:dGTPase